MKTTSKLPEREVRLFKAAELRIDFADGKPRIIGYAAVFNQPSEELGNFQTFREFVAPGAFTRTIAEDDIRALFNHDPNFVIGRNRAGTLKLTQDDHGLRYDIDPPDTQIARDLMESIKRGDISQNSFGFETRKDQWEEKDDGSLIRTLVDVKLYDISPVTYPAYPQTNVDVRASLEVVLAAGREQLRAAAAPIDSAMELSHATHHNERGMGNLRACRDSLDAMCRSGGLMDIRAASGDEAYHASRAIYHLGAAQRENTHVVRHLTRLDDDEMRQLAEQQSEHLTAAVENHGLMMRAIAEGEKQAAGTSYDDLGRRTASAWEMGAALADKFAQGKGDEPRTLRHRRLILDLAARSI